MKVLVTGGSGLLGLYLQKHRPKGAELVPTYFSHPSPGYVFLDLRDYSLTDRLVRYHSPDVIIHTAAEGSVDKVERNPEIGLEINVEGTRKLLEIAGEVGVGTFVHISSNAVFSGNRPPYSEDDPLDPINEYGRQKAWADELVLGSGLSYLIVRPILLYGQPGKGRGNWVTFCLTAFAKGEKVKAAGDVITQPLYVGDCASFVWGALERDIRGVYHIGGPSVSIYDFSRLVASVFGFSETLVERVSIQDIPGLAPRPLDTSYDMVKLGELGVRTRGVVEGLETMKLDMQGGG